MVRIPAEDYFAGREKAKFLKHDDNADRALAQLSIWQRALLNIAPVKVGVVDWGFWEDGKERTLPMYLLRHRDGKRMHTAVSYKNGFPGYNERLTCHCGYRHVTSSVTLGHLKAILAISMMAFRVRHRQRRTPQSHID